MRDNLEVKEVVVGKGEGRRRYVVVRNPAQVARDRGQRQPKLARIDETIADQPAGGEKHTKAVCELVAHKSLGRPVKMDRGGHPVIDRAKVKAEERLDGKYLVITSDDSLSTEDVALGYKQLAEVECAWRSLNSELDLRPMNHRKAERIKAHLLLCWLALLLVRVVEIGCEESWTRMRQEMDRLQRGVFAGPAGRAVSCDSPTPAERDEDLQRGQVSWLRAGCETWRRYNSGDGASWCRLESTSEMTWAVAPFRRFRSLRKAVAAGRGRPTVAQSPSNRRSVITPRHESPS